MDSPLANMRIRTDGIHVPGQQRADACSQIVGIQCTPQRSRVERGCANNRDLKRVDAKFADTGQEVQVRRPKSRIPRKKTHPYSHAIRVGHNLLSATRSFCLHWGVNRKASSSDSTRSQDAERLCRQFLQQKVASVFFAPIEFLEGGDRTNFRLVAALRAANVPVVLLDRSHEEYPRQSDLDLVGIDNHRAGLVLANHLWKQGARRIVFAARHRSANTILERIAGYETALRMLGSEYRGHVFLGDAEDESLVGQMLSSERPDGIICGNDVTAARMMATLIKMGVAIPKQVRMVGIDDVSYARYLPVPLTTIHQDCENIGSIAMMLMLDRVRNPQRKAIDARVPFELVVRESCGAAHGNAKHDIARL